MQHSVFMEAWLSLWLRLLTETMPRGGLHPYRYFATPWSSNELLNRWMECFLPKVEISRSDVLRGWIENWWNLTGVVPRSLYLEALEKKEVLRTRLEEAEATIQQLRGARGQGTQGNEIQTWEAAVNLWQIAIQTTVKAQSEWMRTWIDFTRNNNNHQRG
jgi:hypothetical protein